MKARFSSPKPFLWGALLSLAAFAFAFVLCFRQDRDLGAQIFQGECLYFGYAASLRDDMALIDASRRLENSRGVLAFEAKEGTRVAAEGGNRNFLPAFPRPGVFFRFPSTWIIHQGREESVPMAFTLVLRIQPGPLAGGLLAAGAVLLGFGLGFFLGGTLSNPRKTESQPQDRRAVPPPPLPLPVGGDQTPRLFLDRQFVIQQVTAEAARLLGKDPSQLSGRHLLDLDPQPGLVVAVERGVRVKVVNPFLSVASLSVSLVPDPQGTFLIFESHPEGGTPQKH